MVPRVVRRSEGDRNGAPEFDLSFDHPKSIGRLRGFQGNYGCFVRAYAYICSLGAEGLREGSETAVLNANYLVARLRALGADKYLPLAFGELCMHEFVLSGAPMKRDLKIRTLDVAKRLLDHGVHPPTVRRAVPSPPAAPADAASDFAHSQLKPACVQSLTALAPSAALTTSATRG